jgi:hypothetical protein
LNADGPVPSGPAISRPQPSYRSSVVGFVPSSIPPTIDSLSASSSHSHLPSNTPPSLPISSGPFSPFPISPSIKTTAASINASGKNDYRNQHDSHENYAPFYMFPPSLSATRLLHSMSYNRLKNTFMYIFNL